ncbi:MAG: HAD-IC family P-type ATPase, partial [Candidatus Undinarchaeales archaeon]|nr:HAD-IC family P-type ATPase [Candidatus Undinarchaeales archaeon]
MVVDHPPLVAADDPMYKKRLDDVLVEMGTTLAGLSDRQTAERLDRFGQNKLPEAERRPAWRLLLDQFLEPLILLLLVSAIVSYFVGKTKDAVGIFLATVLNCSLGFRQEIMSRRSVDALKQMSSFTARMLRDDTEEIVDVADIVPGDILLLEEGEKVPADARLIEAYSFQVDESSLTGESLPVAKRADRITNDVPLAERTNMVYMGTHVTRGRAVAVIIGTGIDTEMGRIASIVAEEPGPTPLQVQIADLAKKLGAFAVLVCTLFFVLSMMSGHDIVEVFSVSVSLAVAAIPEGLPTVVTVTLALGMRRMAEEKAIVKQLPAVETLGCTTVICSDKTGTLTHNKMTVREVFFNGRSFLVTGDGYSHHGDFFFDPDVSAGCHSADAAGEAATDVNGRQAQADPEELFPLAEVAFLCNNAALVDGEAIGDPTEAALKVLGYKAGATDILTKRLKRIDEVPFESDIRHMVTVHQDHESGATVTFVKGALDVVLDMCDHVYFDGKSLPLGPDQVACIEEVNDAFCEKAMRVLAFAYGDDNRKDDPTGLVFAGLVGMIDPARAEVHDAVAQCRAAGIRVVMITGDQKHTAMAVARELDILEDNDEACTGSEIDEMDDKAFGEKVLQCNVFSRVTPEHKVRILEALKAKGHIVAMT